MLEKHFLDLVRGQSQGMTACGEKFALRLISLGYEAGVRFNNFLYDKEIKKIKSVSVPVISVGNITMGGTGKTPFTAWLAEYFISRGFHPALISRGYHSQIRAGETKPLNDEARELALRLTDVPHVQGPDRFQIASGFLDQHRETDLIILDDAFQHRRLARTVDIVLLDALDPFGCNAIFPRGLLREPVPSLKRADFILLSRADLVSSDIRQEIKDKVFRYSPRSVWGEIIHSFRRVFSCRSGEKDHQNSFDEWKKDQKNRRFIAFCGLGNPDGFRKSLEKAGIVPVEFRSFADHHLYTEQEAEQLAADAEKYNISGFLTTMKDRVKWTPKMIALLKNYELTALETGIEFISDEDLIKKTLAQSIIAQSIK